MVYTVTPSDGYSLVLQQESTASSVLQNVALILGTRCGTVPMHRDFGLPMRFLDMPIDAAEAVAYAEISEALETYEPRAKLKDVVFSAGADGTAVISAEVEIADEQGQ